MSFSHHTTSLYIVATKTTKTMQISIAGYNSYQLSILTKDKGKNFTTSLLLTIGHLPMFVVKSIVI